MPIQQPFAVKTVLGDNAFELKADPGEAFMVLDILTYYEGTAYTTVKIGQTTVGYFRNGGPFGGHLSSCDGFNKHSHTLKLMGSTGAIGTDYWHAIRNVAGDATKAFIQSSGLSDPSDYNDIEDFVNTKTGPRPKGLLTYLREKGLWKGFPVAEGETFRLEGLKRSNCVQVVIYQIWDPGDIKPEMENGSRSKEYMLINYGNCGGDIQATADNLFSTSKNPAEFPDFPFGKVCPARYEVEIHGILGSAFAPKENTDAAHSYTRFLKLVKDRETLFDEDRQGIPFECRALSLGDRMDKYASGISMIGNYSEHDVSLPLMFNPPLTYREGDELNIYVTLVVTGVGQVIAIDEHEIGLIQKIRRLD